MLRLTVLSGPSSGQSVTTDEGLVRIGSGAGARLRLGGLDPVHAEIRFERGRYSVVDLARRPSLWVNGARVTRRVLISGDRLRLGGREGPEVTVEVVRRRAGSTVRPKPTIPPRRAQVPLGVDEEEPATAMVASRARLGDESAALAAEAAADLVAQERMRLGLAAGSGRTMVIFAEAMVKLRERLEHNSSRKLRRWVLGVSIPAAMVLLLLGALLVRQQRAIAALELDKRKLDGEIAAIQKQIESETDAQRLERLDEQLDQLMGEASQKVAAVAKQSRVRGEELREAKDPTERALRRILKQFNAETYAIPPGFLQLVRESVEIMKRDRNIELAKRRRERLWPHIQAALTAKQLPEELGYIAYTESAFDPMALNKRSGARGMWQFMEESARNCGLRVDGKVDERIDPARSSVAAACHLSNLLIEFGEESVLLVLASYNRGENGVRRALHKVAREPGGFRKRDFWHLYRRKLLPEETRLYVPRVLAAAIVLGEPPAAAGASVELTARVE